MFQYHPWALYYTVPTKGLVEIVLLNSLRRYLPKVIIVVRVFGTAGQATERDAPWTFHTIQCAARGDRASTSTSTGRTEDSSGGSKGPR